MHQMSESDLAYKRVSLRRQLRRHGADKDIRDMDLFQLREKVYRLGLVPFDPCLFSRPVSEVPSRSHYGCRCMLESGHTGDHKFREVFIPPPEVVSSFGDNCKDELDIFD